MTADEFRDCLACIGWSQADLADRLSVRQSTIRYWAAGRWEIPADVSQWLATMADWLEQHPAPVLINRSFAELR